jgi:hypothetical protein
MSAICYCRNATIKESSQGEKYCDDCGAWWSPKYGSTEPDGTSKRNTKNPIFREKRDPYVKIKELPGRNSGCPYRNVMVGAAKEKASGPLDAADCSVSSETPESDRLIQKQGVTHAELYRALCAMERERNKAQRIAIKSRGIIVTLEKGVTTAAVKLVEFWEAQGGGNGVMARAMEDALIREVSAYKKTPTLAPNEEA